MGTEGSTTFGEHYANNRFDRVSNLTSTYRIKTLRSNSVLSWPIHSNYHGNYNGWKLGKGKTIIRLVWKVWKNLQGFGIWAGTKRKFNSYLSVLMRSENGQAVWIGFMAAQSHLKTIKNSWKWKSKQLRSHMVQIGRHEKIGKISQI